VAGAIIWFVVKEERRVHQTSDNIETVILPDGSEVTLNRWSTLAYNSDFNRDERSLTLNGEAFFEVNPDATKPFVVNTGDARIQVIGTSFNVLAYDTLKTVEVIVETGIVSLAPAKGTTRGVELLAGEKGIMSRADNSLSIAVNEDLNFLSWNTQHLVFVDSDLMSVFQTLEKTYHVQISVETEIPPSCIVTVTFDKQSFESVMRVLENTLNLKYTIEGDKVVITDAGC
jgi:ferric-dicitrate binding protein FerR (iron transport regulator)